RRNRARADRAAKRIEGRLDHVVRIGRPDRLRHHVLHAQRLEDGAHRAAGDDAGAGRGGAQDDLAGAIAADDVVMERAPFAQRHAHHAAARLIGRLADRLGHFARLARAIADTALAVADDDDRGKAEAPAALHHLGDTVDADQLFDELAVVAIAIARLAVAIAAPAPLAARTAPASTAGGPSAAGGTSATAGRTCAAAWCACHEAPFLEIEAALAGGVGQGLDPAMEEIAAAVEDHRADTGRLGALGDELADRRRGGLVGAALEALAQALVDARRRRQGLALRVVDHLGIDVLRGAEHAEPRPASRMLGDPAAHAPLPAAEQVFGFAAHGTASTSSCLPCDGYAR